MESIIKNPGFQHITEMILFNLNIQAVKKCQLLNKSVKNILEGPMFWLRKWRMQRGLSKKNYDDWVRAIQLTKNTNVEANVQLYLEKVIETGHVVDVPCFIDSDAIQNSTKFTFEKAFEKRKHGILQILASMEKYPNKAIFNIEHGGISPVIGIAAMQGDLNIVKILAPITKHPISWDENGFNPIHCATLNGHLDILKFLVSFTDDPNFPELKHHITPIIFAAIQGQIEALKILAPLTKNPNEGIYFKRTPLQWAQYCRHHEFARLLQSFTNNAAQSA